MIKNKLNITSQNELKKVIDWGKIDKNKYLLSIERSVINNLEIKDL